MSDWKRVFGFEKNTYVKKYPVNSFLLSGVSFYKDAVKDINIGDLLDMNFEVNNKYDSSAISIKKITDLCGYVPKDLKEKIIPFVPSQIKVIDKQLVEDNVYSVRVDIVEKAIN